MAGLTEDGVDACGMLDRGSEIWLDWNLGDDASLREFRCVLTALRCRGGPARVWVC